MSDGAAVTAYGPGGSLGASPRRPTHLLRLGQPHLTYDSLGPTLVGPPSGPSTPRLARASSTDTAGSGIVRGPGGAVSLRPGAGDGTSHAASQRSLLTAVTSRPGSRATAHTLATAGATSLSGVTGVSGGSGGGGLRHRASLFEAVKRTRLRSRLVAVATFVSASPVRGARAGARGGPACVCVPLRLLCEADLGGLG
jgi:hypothetical protein